LPAHRPSNKPCINVNQFLINVKSQTYAADLFSWADDDTSVELDCDDGGGGKATGSKPGTGGSRLLQASTLDIVKQNQPQLSKCS